MKHICAAVVVLVYLLGASAQTHLSGDISAINFIKDNNPFIVDQDIIIPANKKVEVKEGVVLLFKPFTGMRVNGELYVIGSKENPVVFTTINDTTFNRNSKQTPNSFDWNGMYVSEESKNVKLSNFIMCYTVYGIKSINQNIHIMNGTFMQNGMANLSINDQVQTVFEKIPYTYNAHEEQAAGPVTVTEKSLTEDQPAEKKVKTKPEAVPKKPAEAGGSFLQSPLYRYGTLGIGAAGAVSGIMLGMEAKRENDYLHEKSLLPANQIPDREVFLKDWNDHEIKRNAERAFSVITGVLGLLGITGFTLSFVF